MKTCPQCQRSYEREDILYCLDDGAALPGATTLAAADTAADAVGPGNFATRPEGDTQVQVRVTPAILGPGSKVGEYIIERQIGEGGMGVIFSATHPIIGKKVAIKLLNMQMAANPEVVQRFVQEAKSVNQIRHRNIVDIFAFGELLDGRHYFVMEYLEGEALGARLQRRELQSTDAVRIWTQVASAIEAAHKHDIVHRDLKPDNVFITPTADGPFVKVLDFGVAKLLGDSPAGLSKTSTGVPIGTPAYMAPEQAAGAAVDHRADIYAFGIIMYETVARRPPFVGETLIALLNAHISEPPPPLQSLVENVDPGLASLIDRMLAKEPSERPVDMGAVLAELGRLRDAADAAQKPLFGIAKPTVPRSATKRPKSKGGPPVAALGLLGVAAAIGGVVVLTRPPQAPSTNTAMTSPTTAVVTPPTSSHRTRVQLTTNVPAARVFLDKSDTDRSDAPIAAGGGMLRFNVPPGQDWVMRVESPGFKSVSMPLRLGEDEEAAIPLVMQPNAPSAAPSVAGHRPTGSHVVPKKGDPQPSSAASHPKTPGDGKFMDPF